MAGKSRMVLSEAAIPPNLTAPIYRVAGSASCRAKAVSHDRQYMDAPTLPSFPFMKADRIRLHQYIRTFAAA